jgi:hypothetical protein
MRSLVYLPAAIGILAGWSSAGPAQSNPSSPSRSEPVTTAAPNLAGTWDAITRSYGGIGSTTILSPDSSFALVLGAMVDMKYRLEGNKFTFFSNEPGKEGSETQTLTFTAGQPVFSGNGCSRKLTRLDPLAADSGLVGRWKSIHMTGVPAYEQYTADGLTRLRVPLQVQKGSFSIVGSSVVFHTTSPQREDWAASFRLNGDTLTFSIGGERHQYLRAQPLIPLDVQQPAKPAGMVC